MRKLALLLTLLLALSLTACGGESAKTEEPVTEETVTEAVTEDTTEAVTEEATEAVTEEATEAVTEEATEAVTEEAAEAVTEEATEAVTEAKAPVSGPNDNDPVRDDPTQAEDDAEQPATDLSAGYLPDGAAPVQNGAVGDGPLVCTISLDRDGNFEYTFDVLYVLVPQSWAGKFIAIQSDESHVNFYHKASYEAWQENYGFSGGFMFGISMEERGVDPDYPDEQYLGYARNGQDYYMIFPTDVQGYMDDEEIFNEWNEMMKEMGIVEQNSYSMLFHD